MLEKMSRLDKLNNTLTARQKQLIAELLGLEIPVSLQDSYNLLNKVLNWYKLKLNDLNGIDSKPFKSNLNLF